MAPNLNSHPEKATKSFQCTYKDCNAIFAKNSKLQFHIRKNHTGERPFICDEDGCDKTYTNSSHLRRHKAVSHEKKQESQPIICDVQGCGAILANKYSLKKHYDRKHSEKKSAFICAHCNQSFHRKKILQQHMTLHSEEALFKCSKCEFSFTTSKDLIKHNRRHKTYECNCGEIFHRWSLITAHKKSCVTPEFTCKHCKKSFSTSSNFKAHLLTHIDTTERQVFECPIENCYRFYLYKKNLVYHINKFHKAADNNDDNEKYPCNYPACTLVLKTKQTLKSHMQHHFKWMKKKDRKPRCDKGQPKKNMVEILTGVRLDSAKEIDSREQNNEDKLKSSEDELVKKKYIKPICDKGQPKKNITNILSGFRLESIKEIESSEKVVEQNNEDKSKSSEEELVSGIEENVSEEDLLKQCDLALNMLQNKIIASA